MMSKKPSNLICIFQDTDILIFKHMLSMSHAFSLALLTF